MISQAKSPLKTQTNFLYMDIEYNIKTDEHKITGSLNDEGKISILETFIMGQTGQGVDKTPSNIRDVYNIRLKWYPENDDIVATYDTGNKGLRDGILMYLLGKITT